MVEPESCHLGNPEHWENCVSHAHAYAPGTATAPDTATATATAPVPATAAATNPNDTKNPVKLENCYEKVLKAVSLTPCTAVDATEDIVAASAQRLDMRRSNFSFSWPTNAARVAPHSLC